MLIFFKIMVFGVIYRWRVSPENAQEFVRNWEQGTSETYRIRGSLGSSLHGLPDGSYLAYARWPNRESWQRMRDETRTQNRNPLGELVGEPIEMELISDLLEDETFKQ